MRQPIPDVKIYFAGACFSARGARQCRWIWREKTRRRRARVARSATALAGTYGRKRLILYS